MNDLLIYSGLSLLALGLYHSWRRAPARWRFRLAVVMLLLALLPGSKIPTLTVSTSMTPDWVRPASQTIQASVPNDISMAALPLSSGLEIKFWWLAVGGALALALLLARQYVTLRRWHSYATAAPELVARVPENLRNKAAIRILPASRIAATTGFWHPTVWIGELLLDDPRLECVLAHELVHAGQNDHRWAVLITAVRCLLWWHPLVWLWSTLARREIEFSCDQICQNAFTPLRYHQALASLLQDWGQPTTPLPALGISTRPGLNIQRLKRMEVFAMPRLSHVISLIIAVMVIPLVFLRPVGAEQNPVGSTSISETEQGIKVAINDVPVSVVLRGLVGSADLEGLYIHSSLRDVLGYARLEVEGEGWDQVIPLVMEELGLSWRIDDRFLIVAPAAKLDDPAWFPDTSTLSQRPPPAQILADVSINIDGEIESLIDNLVLVENNWTGFLVQEMRFNLRAILLSDDLVQLELVVYGQDSDEVLASPFLVTRYDNDAAIEVGASRTSNEKSLRIAVTPHRL